MLFIIFFCPIFILYYVTNQFVIVINRCLQRLVTVCKGT